MNRKRLHLVALLVSAVGGAALIACNAASLGDDGGSSASDLSGSVGDNRACLVQAAYAQASLDDITQITGDEFKAATGYSRSEASFCGSFVVKNIGKVFFAETVSGTEFYAAGSPGQRLALMSSTQHSWFGPENHALDCEDVGASSSSSSSGGESDNDGGDAG